jgi:hypothetical protein
MLGCRTWWTGAKETVRRGFAGSKAGIGAEATSLPSLHSGFMLRSVRCAKTADCVLTTAAGAVCIEGPGRISLKLSSLRSAKLLKLPEPWQSESDNRRYREDSGVCSLFGSSSLTERLTKMLLGVDRPMLPSALAFTAICGRRRLDCDEQEVGSGLGDSGFRGKLSLAASANFLLSLYSR